MSSRAYPTHHEGCGCSGCHHSHVEEGAEARGRRIERDAIVDAIRERGNKWGALVGKGPEAARAVMYEIADEIEAGKLAGPAKGDPRG